MMAYQASRDDAPRLKEAGESSVNTGGASHEE